MESLINDTEEEPSTWVSTHKLRNGKIVKVPRERLWESHAPMGPRPPKTRKLNTSGDKEVADAEIEDSSQESISMLQGCWEETPVRSGFPELEETCMNSELEVIQITEDEGTATWIMRTSPSNKSTVENGTQTDFYPRVEVEEKEMAKHGNFIGFVIKLKGILSSKKKTSEGNLWSILNNAEEDDSSSEDEEQDSPVQIKKSITISTERTAYLLHSTDVENVFSDTVRGVLFHLEEILANDSWELSWCWRNSVYEMAVDMVNQAVDSQVGVRKIVELFLRRTIASILKNDDNLKNLILESKAMFVATFCRSTYLSYSTINYIIRKIKILKTINRGGNASLEEKTSFMNLTKTSYFLLRILETLLQDFKTIVEAESGFFIKQEKQQGVLDKWKEHGRENVGDSWTGNVKKWCDELDDILVHCVVHVPVSSMVVDRCGRLAKNILKMCHPGDIL